MYNELVLNYNHLVDINKQERYIWKMIDQSMKLVFVYMIWLFIMRLKRVEIQVNEGHNETTIYIFRRMKCNRAYYISFLAVLFLIQLPLMLKIAYDRHQYNKMDWKTYVPGEHTVTLTVMVDLLIIVLMIALLLNYLVILRSV